MKETVTAQTTSGAKVTPDVVSNASKFIRDRIEERLSRNMVGSLDAGDFFSKMLKTTPGEKDVLAAMETEQRSIEESTGPTIPDDVPIQSRFIAGRIEMVLHREPVSSEDAGGFLAEMLKTAPGGAKALNVMSLAQREIERRARSGDLPRAK